MDRSFISCNLLTLFKKKLQPSSAVDAKLYFSATPANKELYPANKELYVQIFVNSTYYSLTVCAHLTFLYKTNIHY